jgi:hypothetical protein
VIVKTKCVCGHTNQIEMSIDWVRSGSCPITCFECGTVYVASTPTDIEDTNIEEHFPEDDITEMPSPLATELATFNIDDAVIIDNEAHELHKQEGLIIDKDFLHYKIQFKNGKHIWVPHHWAVLKKTN